MTINTLKLQLQKVYLQKNSNVSTSQVLIRIVYDEDLTSRKKMRCVLTSSKRISALEKF